MSFSAACKAQVLCVYFGTAEAVSLQSLIYLTSSSAADLAGISG
jgi:hypothetical protein